MKEFNVVIDIMEMSANSNDFTAVSNWYKVEGLNEDEAKVNAISLFRDDFSDKDIFGIEIMEIR